MRDMHRDPFETWRSRYLELVAERDALRGIVARSRDVLMRSVEIERELAVLRGGDDEHARAPTKRRRGMRMSMTLRVPKRSAS